MMSKKKEYLITLNDVENILNRKFGMMMTEVERHSNEFREDVRRDLFAIQSDFNETIKELVDNISQIEKINDKKIAKLYEITTRLEEEIRLERATNVILFENIEQTFEALQAKGNTMTCLEDKTLLDNSCNGGENLRESSVAQCEDNEYTLKEPVAVVTRHNEVQILCDVIKEDPDITDNSSNCKDDEEEEAVCEENEEDGAICQASETDSNSDGYDDHVHVRKMKSVHRNVSGKEIITKLNAWEETDV